MFPEYAGDCVRNISDKNSRLARFLHVCHSTRKGTPRYKFSRLFPLFFSYYQFLWNQHKCLHHPIFFTTNNKLYRFSYGFSRFNLKLICTSEFFTCFQNTAKTVCALHKVVLYCSLKRDRVCKKILNSLDEDTREYCQDTNSRG